MTEQIPVEQAREPDWDDEDAREKVKQAFPGASRDEIEREVRLRKEFLRQLKHIVAATRFVTDATFGLTERRAQEREEGER